MLGCARSLTANQLDRTIPRLFETDSFLFGSRFL
jgi:hypothetical protein